MASYRVGQPSRPIRVAWESMFFWIVRIHSPFADSRSMNAFPRGVKATHKFVVFSAKGRPDSHFVTAYKSTKSFRFTRHHACQLCHLAVSR